MQELNFDIFTFQDLWSYMTSNDLKVTTLFKVPEVLQVLTLPIVSKVVPLNW